MFLRFILLLSGIFLFTHLNAQCPTSGTISADCTTNGNLNITGNTLNVNSGVIVTVTGTLQIRAGGTLNGTDAVFNLGTLQTGYGSVNTINGGTYNINSFSGGNDTDISNATITVSSTFTSGYGVFNYTNSTINIEGLFSVGSDNNNLNNSTINSGTGNPGTNDGVALTINGGGALNLINSSQMNVRGSWTNNELYIDDSDVVVTGDFDNAGSEVLEVTNGGTISIGGDFNNSGSGNVSAESAGIVQVDGDYNNSGGGSTDVNGGGLVVGGSFSGNPPTGDTESGCTGGSGGCCGAACSTLPVQLISFSGQIEDNSVSIEWKTATEINNDYFTLAISTDGKEFTKIAEIMGQGTTSEPSNYSYRDAFRIENKKSIYYRLSQTDFDGTIENLGIIYIQSEEANQTSSLKMYPNPAKSGIPIKFTGLSPTHQFWKIYDLNGKLIDCGAFLSSNEIPTQQLKKGTYLVNIQSDLTLHTKKILIK